MIYTLQKKDKKIYGELRLPASKSISNRLLMIEAMCPNSSFDIQNLSDSNDSQVMQQALEAFFYTQGMPQSLDMQDAGTAMRFVTAYAATHPCHVLLTGCERMKERPIGILVDKLRQLGADISYRDKQGYPPLLLRGASLSGGAIKIDATVSSQFVSALMLVAPAMQKGLSLSLEGEAVSTPYIDMTAQLMAQCGFKVLRQANDISIPPQPMPTLPPNYVVESDWSAASYWYQMVALADEADLFLHGLQKDSLQGDAVLAQWYEPLGVQSRFEAGGVRLRRVPRSLPSHYEGNFRQQPDLVQTFVCTLAALQCPATLKGVANLRYKETDRLLAMQQELQNMGVEVQLQHDSISILPQRPLATSKAVHTYADHRMAMAFAALGVRMGKIAIANPQCVSKSYPHFWQDMKAVGFAISNE